VHSKLHHGTGPWCSPEGEHRSVRLARTPRQSPRNPTSPLHRLGKFHNSRAPPIPTTRVQVPRRSLSTSAVSPRARYGARVDRITASRRAPFGSSPEVGERGARTQRRIIDAGLVVFGEVGYVDASIGAITDTAGCSRASFYQYFASKEDLFLRMTALVAVEQLRILDRLGRVTSDRQGRDAIHGWLVEYIEHYHTYSPVFGAYAALTQYDPTITKGAAKVSLRLATRLAEKFQDTPRSWQQPGVHARLLITLVSRAPAFWRVADAGIGRDRLASSLADLVHRCVYGPIVGVNVNDYPDVVAISAPDPSKRVETKPSSGSEGGTRGQLLAAGSKVFPRLGHHGTRVDDIVAEAGVAHGTFYRYFEDKDDLFVTLATTAAEAMIELVSSFPADANAEKLQMWFQNWFDSYSQNVALITVWISAAESSPSVRELGSQLALQTGTSVGGLLAGHTPGDLAVDTIALIAWLERLPINVSTLRDVSQEDAVDAVSDLVRRGMLTRP
jgi:AcrR family transcriptional regulator